MSKGCFIVFEGIDGSGKSEQYRRLTRNLEKKKYPVVQTKEPTVDLPVGKLIRSILYQEQQVAEEALALLFAADRVDHTEKKIKPALEQGSVVVSDRYVYSSLAYQSGGMKKELSLEWVREINSHALMPDIVVFLDITPEVGQSRLANGQVRVKDHTYFESLSQQERIRSAYYKVFNFGNVSLTKFTGAEKGEDRVLLSRIEDTVVLRVDGTLPVEEIEKIVLKHVLKALRENCVRTRDKKMGVTKSLEQFTA
ncbi:MAG: dTMP kinase [Candidatus Bathyarchaeota archaeon]